MPNAKSRWPVRPFNAIAENDVMPSDVDSNDCIDCILRNMTARVELADADQKTYIIWVTRADAWMTSATEEL